MKRMPTDEAEFWVWYGALSKEEQLTLIKQTLEEDPEAFTQKPGRWCLNEDQTLQ